MTTGNDKIAILNTSRKIRTVKGQTNTNRKGSTEPRRFKSHLQPLTMNMIPVAFWNIYKRQRIVKSWLATGILIAGKDAEIPQRKIAAEQAEKIDPTAVAEAAAVAQLKSEGDDDGEDYGKAE